MSSLKRENKKLDKKKQSYKMDAERCKDKARRIRNEKP